MASNFSIKYNRLWKEMADFSISIEFSLSKSKFQWNENVEGEARVCVWIVNREASYILQRLLRARTLEHKYFLSLKFKVWNVKGGKEGSKKKRREKNKEKRWDCFSIMLMVCG